MSILWVTTQTQLLKPKKKKFLEQGSGLSSLGRLMRRTTSFVSLCVSPCFWQIRCPVDRSWCAQRCRDGAGLRISVAAATPSQQRLRRSSVAAALIDGKHVFQCFWSDPITRVFECFGVSLCILDGKHGFQCFWSGPTTRVFECFSEVLYCFCHLGQRCAQPRTMSGRRGIDGQSSPSGKFATFGGTPSFTIKPCFFKINLP